MDLVEAEKLIEAFRAVAVREPDRPTIMELSGYPHWETVCSNLLAFFFDPSSPHGLETLCLDALLDAAGLDGKRQPLSNVAIEREAGTNAGNKLDLLVTSDSHVIAVENKIFAPLANPLADYAALAAVKANKEQHTVVKILLALRPPPTDPGHGFIRVSYEHFFRVLRGRLGQQNECADAQYYLYLKDFITTIENLKRGTRMDPSLLNFLRERAGDVTKLLSDVQSFKDELRRRVTDLRPLINVRSPNFVEQSFYREPNELYDCLVYDIQISPSLTIAIDTVLSPAGWRIEVFNRDKRADTTEVRDLLKNLDILFEEINLGRRLLHPDRFDFGASIEHVGSCLQPIIDALVLGFGEQANGKPM